MDSYLWLDTTRKRVTIPNKNPGVNWLLLRLERLCVHVLSSFAGHWRHAFFFVLPVYHRVCLCVFP